MFQAAGDAAGAHGEPAAGREEGWAGGQEEAQREAARAPAAQQVGGEDPLVQGHCVLCRYKPDTVDTVARETQFSKEEVKCLYRAFKQECPTGEMGIGMYFMIFICASTGISDEETFKEVYQKIFPLGDSSKYAGLVFRLELETMVHPKVRNHGGHSPSWLLPLSHLRHY